ncbi:MAG: serine/threonine protein kinase, partial [Polyangiaceae bacterium]
MPPRSQPHIVPYEIAVGQYLPGHDYRCERLLGRGGMGSVYQMVRGELRFEVAVKLLHMNLATQPQFVQLFLEEARILKQVGDHPNLPRILDFAKLPDGTPFIVMELLDGNSLGRIMRSEPGKKFDRDVAFRIIDQVLAGVFELHSQGIIHRDLKPDNIFLERRAKAGPGAAVKILDCGLA